MRLAAIEANTIIGDEKKVEKNDDWNSFFIWNEMSQRMLFDRKKRKDKNEIKIKLSNNLKFNKQFDRFTIEEFLTLHKRNAFVW